MIEYVVLRLEVARRLALYLEGTTWCDEKIELERMIALADWYNWSGQVPLQWALTSYTNRNIRQAAEFFEVPFETREFTPA